MTHVDFKKLNIIHEPDGRGERNHGVRFRENLTVEEREPAKSIVVRSTQLTSNTNFCVYEKQVQLKKGLIIWVLQKKSNYFVSILTED